MSPISHEVRLWMLAGAFALVGLGLIALGGIGKPAGEAFIIAAALAVSVDRYIKLKLRDEIAHDVFFAALGIHLPAEIKKEMLAISEYLLVRRNLDVTYRIRRHSEPTFVECEIDVVFEMENFTDLPQKFVHQLSVVDPPSGIVKGPNPILSVKGTVNNVVAYALEGDQIHITKSSNASDWASAVKIDPGTKAAFVSKTKHVLPIGWEDMFIFAEPTIGVQVRIEAPPEFTVNVIFDHRLGQDVQPTSDRVWRLNEAFLPNTLFRPAWKLTSPAPTDGLAKPMAPAPAA